MGQTSGGNAGDLALRKMVEKLEDYTPGQEVIIGKYGEKALYRKVITQAVDWSVAEELETKMIPHNIQNLNDVIKISVVLLTPNRNNSYTLPYITSQGIIKTWLAPIDRETLNFKTIGVDWNGYTLVATIEYTKTV